MTDGLPEGPRPIHLAVLTGASAGLYAVSLAMVAALQSSSDAAVMAARAPLDQAIRDLSATNDRIAGDLDRVGRADDTLASTWDPVGPALDATESTLDRLSTTVARITGAAGALPDRVAIPAVPRTVVARGTTPAHTTTGASGGG
jgi:hypothetical protein